MRRRAILQVRNLKVYFHLNEEISKAVDGVDFSIGAGETVCIVGESGSGKTVSALAIMGLLPTPPGRIEAGEIFCNETSLLHLNDKQMEDIRGKQIAMIFQEPMTSLNPLFPIGEQIGEAIRIHENITVEACRKRTLQLLHDVGIPSPAARIHDYPHQLSGGQRQRVMIAIALACNPQLVIADEPTTALDVTVQAQILNLLAELKAKHRMSMLYITHDLGVVSKIADYIYVMYAGMVVEQGTKNEIFTTPCHPYTRGLLASLPNRSQRGQKLASIPGAVPDPARKPVGCPFHPRCQLAIDTCRQIVPGLEQISPNHYSRCPVVKR